MMDADAFEDAGHLEDPSAAGIRWRGGDDAKAAIGSGEGSPGGMRDCQRKGHREGRIDGIASGRKHGISDIGRMGFARDYHGVTGVNRLPGTASGSEKQRGADHFAHS